jgi:lipid-A-disaccharide synthase
MKYYVIAGEASGDLHASNLVRALRNLDGAAEFRGWGGDLMTAQGVELVRHYRDLAFMGFTEVVMNLRTILRNLAICKEDILRHQPDVLILVDYPGFNLRIAKWAKRQGIRVFYYISPQIWAWKQSRVHKIRRDVERMFVILPFEQEFYRRFGMEVDFVGHPLLDAISQWPSAGDAAEWKSTHGLDTRPLVALLPGSRKQEIATMLPLMLEVTAAFPDVQFVIAGAPSLSREFYLEILGARKVPVLQGATYDILRHARAALVTSGTATLETALFNVPEVVCYKGGRISYYIARALVKIEYISLVNLIMGRQVVRELIQQDLTVENLRQELSLLLEGERRERMLADFSRLREALGGPGASAVAAQKMLHYLRRGR